MCRLSLVYQYLHYYAARSTPLSNVYQQQQVLTSLAVTCTINTLPSYVIFVMLVLSTHIHTHLVAK